VQRRALVKWAKFLVTDGGQSHEASTIARGKSSSDSRKRRAWMHYPSASEIKKYATTKQLDGI
jgi:CRISPR/Cas system-associated protein endoribonuclease Cas2